MISILRFNQLKNPVIQLNRKLSPFPDELLSLQEILFLELFPVQVPKSLSIRRFRNFDGLDFEVLVEWLLHFWFLGVLEGLEVLVVAF